MMHNPIGNDLQDEDGDEYRDEGDMNPSINSSINNWKRADGTNIPPDAIIERLKKLNPDQLPRKADGSILNFPKTYKSWDTLTINQKNKVIAMFNKLAHAVQQAVLTLAVEDAANTASSAKQRAELTTKNDLCRLFALRKYAGAKVHWTNASGTLTRRELDARNSSAPNLSGNQTLGAAANPWDELAGIYNDYNLFQPQNESVRYELDPGTSQPKKKNPYEAVSEDLSAIAAHCHELDPTDTCRANIVRDGEWIKKKWTECRGALYPIFTDFERSGRQRASNDEWMSPAEQIRWVYHAGKAKLSPMVMMYSIIIFEKADFESLGRELPVGTGIDNSLIGGSQSQSNATTRETFRKSKTSKEASQGSSNRFDIGEVLFKGNQKDNQIHALSILLQFGITESLKRKAQDELIKHAFGNTFEAADEQTPIRRLRLHDHCHDESDDRGDGNETDEDHTDMNIDDGNERESYL